GQHELAATGDGRPVHGGDDGLRKAALVEPHQRVHGAHVGVARRSRLAERPQVHTRAEGLLAGAGDDDDAHVIVVDGLLESVAHARDQRRAEGVARLGPVEGEHEDRALALLQQDVAHDFDIAMARSARARKPASFSSGVRTRLLRDMIDTSWPSAARRRAPTVASPFFTSVKGSNEYQRMAFSYVIFLMSLSGTFSAANTRHNSSGAPGHMESLWGSRPPRRCCRCRCGRAWPRRRDR